MHHQNILKPVATSERNYGMELTNRTDRTHGWINIPMIMQLLAKVKAALILFLF